MSKYNMLYGYRNGSNVVAQTKQLLLARSIAAKKSVERLHLQLVRKGRVENRLDFAHPTAGAIYIVTNYNIHTSSGLSYAYDGYDNIGLNDLFHARDNGWSTTDDNCDIYAQGVASKGGSGANRKELSEYCPAWADSDFTLTSAGETVFFTRPNYDLGSANVYAIMNSVKVLKSWAREVEGSSLHDGVETVTYAVTAKISLTAKIYRQYFNAETDEYESEYIGSRTWVKDYSKTYADGESLGEWVSDGADGSTWQFSAYKSDYAKADAWRELWTSESASAESDADGAEWIVYSNLKAKYKNPYFTFKYNMNSARTLRVLKKEARSFGENMKYPFEYALHLDDGRVLATSKEYYTTEIYGHGDSATEVTEKTDRAIAIFETFKASDNRPVRGNYNFFHDWSFHFRIVSYDDAPDSPWWRDAVGVAVMAVAMVVSVLTQQYYIAPAMANAGVSATAIAITGAATVMGGIAIGASVAGMITKNAGYFFLAQITGAMSAVLSLGASITNLMTKLGTQTAQAASNASALSSASAANQSGLSQTSALYAGGVSHTAQSVSAQSVMNMNFTQALHFGEGATFGGGISLTPTSAGGFLISEGSAWSIGGATFQTSSYSLYGSGGELLSRAASNAILSNGWGGSISWGGFGGASWLDTALQIGKTLKEGYGVFSDTKSLFKTPGEFEDSSMPTNDEENRAGYGSSDTNELIRRRFYDLWAEPDLGLEPGTLLYIPSARERV